MSGASVIEAMLLRWGESPAGRTVTFLLPDDGTQHPFKGLKTGPSYGQRVALSVALISDDETQTPAPAAKERKRWDELALSAQIGIRCNDPQFQQHLRAPDADAAARIVRSICEVKSRKDIIKGTPAARQWEGIEWSFQNWLREMGQ